MSLWLFVALICLGLVGCEVEVLTEANFDATALSGKWFIKFYAPWCGHCKKMAPAWVELSNSLPASVARVAEIDCTANTALCSRYGVRGYPTLKLLVDGTVYDYSGSRDLAAFTEFATSSYANSKPAEAKKADAKAEPKPVAASADTGAIAQFASAGDLFATLSSPTPVFLAFTAKWCGHCKKMAPEWQKFAESAKGLAVVGQIDIDEHKALSRQFSARAVPTLYLVRSRVMYPYAGPRTAEAFTAFLQGEYKNVDPIAVPQPIGSVEMWLSEVFEQIGDLIPRELQQWDFVRDFDKWFQANTATALLIMSLMGVFVGFISGFLSGLMLSVTRRKTQKRPLAVPKRHMESKEEMEKKNQ